MPAYLDRDMAQPTHDRRGRATKHLVLQHLGPLRPNAPKGAGVDHLAQVLFDHAPVTESAATLLARHALHNLHPSTPIADAVALVQKDYGATNHYAGGGFLSDLWGKAKKAARAAFDFAARKAPDVLSHLQDRANPLGQLAQAHLDHLVGQVGQNLDARTAQAFNAAERAINKAAALAERGVSRLGPGGAQTGFNHLSQRELSQMHALEAADAADAARKEAAFHAKYARNVDPETAARNARMVANLDPALRGKGGAIIGGATMASLIRNSGKQRAKAPVRRARARGGAAVGGNFLDVIQGGIPRMMNTMTDISRDFSHLLG